MPPLNRSQSRYSLRQSPLFQLRSKKKLASLLHWSGTGNELDAFANRSDNYKFFVITDEGKSPRSVQEPKPGLQRIHRRLAQLLVRIGAPDYLHSGLRKRSFITNGLQHINGMPAIKLDIKKFYPSTKWAHVYRCFLEDFECSEDVAAVLSSIACVSSNGDRHLPTGSAASQILAFYVHKPMFDAIDAVARARHGVFTLYVDDMVLSLPDASPEDIFRIGRFVSSQGLSWHKHRFFRAGVPKRITGTIAKRTRLEADKRQHFKHMLALRALDVAASSESGPSAARRALGILQSIAQIDKRHELRARGMAKKLIPLANSMARKTV